MRTLVPIFVAFWLFGCQSDRQGVVDVPVESPAAAVTMQEPPLKTSLYGIVVTRDVRVRDFFPYIDRLVQRYDTLVPYPLTEHILVRANPWIIDSLAGTDYYHRMARGQFVYDQRQLVVLHRGDTIFVPSAEWAEQIRLSLDCTVLDLNIPEFTLRVIECDDTLRTIPVRVGQNKRRYQAAIQREANLRTLPGTGKIVWINRTPDKFIEPHTGLELKFTKRDDGRKTLMPLVPWLEPEINGLRNGQMIHPTTNPESIGKAYSNGCVGCSEADAWYLYYYAPVGTSVVFRYLLDIVDSQGDTIHLNDIYNLREKN